MHHRFALTIFSSVLAAGALFVAAHASAAPPPTAIVTGLDAGWPDVRGWNANGTAARQFAPWGESAFGFSPYPTYQNGVRVAVGDVTGDGRPEIVTAPGRSAFTEIKVFDGRSFREVNRVLPFKDASWWEGAYVAVGDTNGDGRGEIVDGLAPGCCTTLHVLDAATGSELAGWFPYGNQGNVGARVAAADVDGDRKAEVISQAIGSSRVDIFGATGGTPARTLNATSGPTSLAAGDIVGSAAAEVVIAAATGSGVRVDVIGVANNATLISMFPYGAQSASSVEVAVGDVDGDGHNDVVTAATTPAGTEVQAVDRNGARLGDFFVVDPPGVSLAAGDLDGDGKAEIVLGAGPTNTPWPPTTNGPDQRVSVYTVDGEIVKRFTAYPGVFQGGVRVALADLDRDFRPEVVTAPGPGMEPEIAVYSQEWVNGRDRGQRLRHFLAYDASFTGGVSVATGDVDFDGVPEIVTGPGPGRVGEVRVFDATGKQLWSFTPFGFDYTGGVNVATGDLNADGKAEIVAGTQTGPGRVRAFAGTVAYGPLIVPFGADSAGVVVGVADVSANARGVLLAGTASGAKPRLALLNPATGSEFGSRELDGSLPNGIRIAAGDLDFDGRQEIVVAPGFGGDGRVRIYSQVLEELRSFRAYDWNGAGMNVAVATRVYFPLAAQPRSLNLRARKRQTVVVATFVDVAGGARTGFQASISWGDGTRTANARVLILGGGLYGVRGVKRYARPGRYSVTVTLTDGGVRRAVARSSALVRR